MSHSILGIDDDAVLREAIDDYLGPHGFTFTARADGRSGLAALAGGGFDLVLLDVMLPGGPDGLEVLRSVRAESRVPVIMLTAKGDEIDRVLGLELGADDYLAKPFSLRELLARTRTLLRRSFEPGERDRADPAGADPPRAVPPRAAPPIRSGPFTLDAARRRLGLGGREIELSAIQANILRVMMENPKAVLPREWLMRAALGEGHFIAGRGVDVHVSHLRGVIRRLAPDLRPIQTQRGAGYSWVGDD